ncbi:MAG: hypothetical protein HWD63_02380 [Candidatus Parvibacillus calidus]|nr:MAG: hypothetical protein HWD63_02380 [Candidatus Parvibacillus calidus]
MADIYFNEEGYPIDSAYRFLYFLSLFNFDGAKWMGTGIEDRAIMGRNTAIRYTIIDRNGKSKILPMMFLNDAFWKYKLPGSAPQGNLWQLVHHS